MQQIDVEEIEEVSMQIKSIKKTNKYKHIEFKNVLNDDRKYRIYTPSGFTDILSYSYIKTGPTVIISIANDTLICDPNHIVVANRNGTSREMFAKDLMSTDKLISYNNELVDFTISDGPITDLYDIEIDDPHLYYTSKMISHNSLLLVNNAITSLKGDGPGGTAGQDVLLVTFELDSIKTAMRCLGALTNVPLNDICDKKDYAKRVVQQTQAAYNKSLCIYEYPPDECSVNHLYALLDNLRRVEGWRPDVLIIDYLDLMISRNDNYNKDDYTRQKHIATEVRGLAKNENILIFTATQTNRDGANEGTLIDLTKSAESFGKQFPLDYVISLNQSSNELKATPPQLRMYIAKNRNGPKHETIHCNIDYNSMRVEERK